MSWAKWPGSVDMFAFIVWSSLAAPLPLFLLSAWLEPGGLVEAVSHPTLKLTICVLTLAYAGTLFGYGVWSKLLMKYPAARVAPFALLVPVVGMVAAWILYGERFGPIEAWGGLLVMAGLVFNVVGGRMQGAAPVAKEALSTMHDIKAIRDDPAAFDAGLARRSLAPLSVKLLALDDARRAAIGEAQKAQERRNAASKEIGAAMGRKDFAAAEALKAEVAKLKADAPALEQRERETQAALDVELGAIPNLPGPDAPDGKDENDNVEVRRWGAPPRFERLTSRASISRSAKRSA